MKYVQAFDPNTKRYRAIEVASGRFADEDTEGQPQPYRNMQEIEPLEKVRAHHPGSADPLGDYR